MGTEAVYKSILTMSALALSLSTATFATAETVIPVGMITTLSGPAGYLGQDIRDGFQLAIDQAGGKLGGKSVRLEVQDDGLKPSNAKQIADTMLSEQKIKLFTGIVFANVANAAVPDILDGDAIYIGANTAAAPFAGKECNPNYFVSSWQDDGQGESAGALAQSLNYPSAFLLAPNYQAGKETMEAFKRFYKGKIVGEVYTKLDQTDFAAEIAQIRDSKPAVIYEFEPGGLGIAFMQQYQQSGLSKDIPMVVHPASLDQVIVKVVGDAAKGVTVTSHWNTDLDNPENTKFIAAWKAKFGDRPITYYAAQGYDAALMMAAGLQGLQGDDVDTKQFRAAVRKADIPSVRGNFKLAANQHPVQDWYALKVEHGEDGKPYLKTVAKVLEHHSDIYADQCKMPAE